MKDCQFCQFVRGEGSFHKIHEDQYYQAVVLQPADELSTVVFPKVHRDRSDYLQDNDLTNFINFSCSIEIMIRRAYPDVEYVGSYYNNLGINHYHEMKVPMRRAGKIDYTKMKDQPKTAAGIAQKIKNWAPVEFKHPELPIRLMLPEWIKEIITDGSLVAGNSNPLIIKLVDVLYLAGHTPAQEEIDKWIDSYR